MTRVEVKCGTPIRSMVGLLVCASILPGMALRCVAAGQRNGNELALEYSTAEAGRQDEISKEASGRLYFFRYLRIERIDRGRTGAGPFVAMQTVEPSSDMRVEFTIAGPVSLRKAEVLRTNDAVAVSGRLATLDREHNKIVLDPVVVRYKDRAAPKTGKELLPELDPEARMGTDTSSGKEVVKRVKE